MTRSRRPHRWRYAAIAAVAAVSAALLTGTSPVNAAQVNSAHSYTGTIDGADYRAEVPAHWNGTLILYSHGYFPPEWTPEGVPLSNHAKTETWLLDQGYAVAGSLYHGDGSGWQYDTAPADQLAVLDWFKENVGEPERTVISGQSMGGGISIRLAERNPELFDGVVAQCAEFDPQANFNLDLDINFVLKTLLAPNADIELVKAADPQASSAALDKIVERALRTPQGRARFALAGAIANIPGWYDPFTAEPTTVADRLTQQALWTRYAHSVPRGPLGRADLEARLGGNPSWNFGIDYRDQLARSSERDLAVKAYRQASLSLERDLDKLADAPRILPDVKPLAWMHLNAVPVGTTPVPIVGLHSSGDGGANRDQAGWYADQVRRHGDKHQLRQLYVDRGGHCSFSAADEIVTLQALMDRLDTGHWPNTNPQRLNAAVAQFGPEYHTVFDFGTGQEAPLTPAFARYDPPAPLRPSD